MSRVGARLEKERGRERELAAGSGCSIGLSACGCVGKSISGQGLYI